MTEPDLKLLKALVEALDCAETHESSIDYINMIKKLLSYYGTETI